MKPSKPFLLGLLLLVGGLQAVLAAAPLAGVEDDRRAKQAVPPTGKALVYVYRQPDAGPELSPVLFLNGRAIGRLSAHTYTLQAVKPGRVDLRAGGAEARTLSLRCQDGRIYFVQLEAGAGGAGLRQVSYGTGRREVHAARLVRETGGEERVARADDSERGAARSGFTLILKGGSFSLGSDSQSILGYQRNFEASSSSFGVEGEWRTASGLAFGAEYFGHSHSYTSTGVTARGDMSATKVLFNFKKYFRPGDLVQPYIGAGVGAAATSFSGSDPASITGSAGGVALQAMSGVAFRWRHVGLYTEAKFQKAESEDANGETVDASGIGLFAGVSFHF